MPVEVSSSLPPMKSTAIKRIISNRIWRAVPSLLIFAFLACIGPSSAQTTKGRQVVSMKVSDFGGGSRVTVVADLTFRKARTAMGAHILHPLCLVFEEMCLRK